MKLALLIFSISCCIWIATTEIATISAQHEINELKTKVSKIENTLKIRE